MMTGGSTAVMLVSAGSCDGEGVAPAGDADCWVACPAGAAGNVADGGGLDVTGGTPDEASWAWPSTTPNKHKPNIEPNIATLFASFQRAGSPLANLKKNPPAKDSQLPMPRFKSSLLTLVDQRPNMITSNIFLAWRRRQEERC